MKLLKLQSKKALLSKKLPYTAALLMLTFSACKKENYTAPSQVNEEKTAAGVPNTLGVIISAPQPTVYFMDKRDLYAVTNLNLAKASVTKRFSMDTEYDEHFNNNDNVTSNTYSYNFKTNEIFSLDYNAKDNSAPYLFKSSVISNAVTETKTTAQLIGGGLQHVRINRADGKVFYVAGGSIFKMDANGANNQLVVAKKSDIIAQEMDIDFSKMLFYYVNFSISGSTLNVCGVNGQNNKIVVASPFEESMTGSQVRLANGKIYFSTNSESKKQFHIWSISPSGDMKTLKNELTKSYTDTWSKKFTFDVLPTLNKIVWSLHQRLADGSNLLQDVSELGRLNLATGVSDILYQGKNINCIVSANF